MSTKFNPYEGERATFYANMTEHEHQRELFSWTAAVSRYGLEQSILWVMSEPRTIKRDKGWWKGRACGNGDTRLAWLHSIPNGGSRGGNKGQRQREGARMKAEGVKRGVADIFLPLPCGTYHGLYLELKTFKGRLSQEQREFGEYVAEVGYLWVCATGYWQAIQSIGWYLGEKEIVRKYFD